MKHNFYPLHHLVQCLDKVLRIAQSVTDNFGVSKVMKFLWGASWTLHPHNSIKIHENPENVTQPPFPGP